MLQHPGPTVKDCLQPARPRVFPVIYFLSATRILDSQGLSYSCQFSTGEALVWAASRSICAKAR